MSHEVTEEHVLSALNLYGDAIEDSFVAASAEQTDPALLLGRPSTERANNQPVTSEIASPNSIRSRRGRALVAALVAAVVVIGGAVLFTRGSSLVDTTPVDAVDVVSVLGDDSRFGPEVIGFGERGATVFADGEFVSLGRDANGLIVARSVDGVSWTTTPVTNAPEGASPLELTQTNDGWLVVFEVWPAADPLTNRFFSNGEQPERMLATSADLLTWDSVDLPSFTEIQGAQSFVQGIAVSDSRVVIVGSVFLDFVNVREVLLSSGAVTEADLENYCDSYTFGEDGFVGLSCDLDEEPMFDVIDPGDSEEVPPPTDTVLDLSEFELFRVEQGEPGYEQLAQLGDFTGGSGQAATVITGPFEGPFEQSLPEIGGDNLDLVGEFNLDIVGTDDGFVLAGTSGSDRTTALESVDGVTFGDSRLVSNNFLLQSFGVSDGRWMAIGQDFNSGTTSLVSDDFGETWSESVVPSSFDFDGTVAGPAGTVVSTVGPLLGEFEVETDGYTMVVERNTFNAGLIGPGGEVIYEVGAAHVIGFGEQDSAGVVRREGEVGEGDIVWLDPTTGEDLVSISSEDLDQVLATTTVTAETEIWFRDEGPEWALLDRTERSRSLSLLAVGDDELLLRETSDVPEELVAFRTEEREPTSTELATLQAWYEDDAVIWEVIAIEQG